MFPIKNPQNAEYDLAHLPKLPGDEDMSIIGIIRIAFKSLARNKTRTFLTMLGILSVWQLLDNYVAIGQWLPKK
jgi:hypothetical protein